MDYLWKIYGRKWVCPLLGGHHDRGTLITRFRLSRLALQGLKSHEKKNVLFCFLLCSIYLNLDHNIKIYMVKIKDTHKKLTCQQIFNFVHKNSTYVD